MGHVTRIALTDSPPTRQRDSHFANAIVIAENRSLLRISRCDGRSSVARHITLRASWRPPRSWKRIERDTCCRSCDADRALAALYPRRMNVGNRERINMPTLIRIIRLVAVAVAATALMAPAAQAKPIDGLPVPTQHTQTPVSSSILKDKLQLPPSVIKTSVADSTPTSTTSDSGFNWTDALIGAMVATVLIGFGVSGMQMSHRRTAQV